MINAQELRIGNTLFSRLSKRMFNVVPLDIRNLNDEPDNADPVEITEQWLMDYHFEPELKNADSPNNRFMVYTKYPLTYNTNHGWWYESRQLKIQPKYIHKLQNLWYELTGEELTSEPARTSQTIN